MSNWNDLSLKEKAAMMQVAVNNGIYKLSDIRKAYNEFAEGGPEEILNKVNSSDANFVQRLKDPNRKYIQDWGSDKIATHKLSVGTDEYGNNYIYPEVQEINGKLVDFTRPPYTWWAGMESAEQRGDTVRIQDLEDAIKFTEEYKKYYPKGKTFAEGGPLITLTNEFSKGGRIYIKPSHRGKFTRLKERTGHSASWFKLHGTPAQRKMATFALNARKWKHGEGGPLVEVANVYDDGGKYTVQKGDTLSHIAKRITGNANNWKELAEYNNIENPNLILIGQQISIPEKYDRPLDYSEIPTRNELTVIDDYSPNFKYIVEGDKIYYSRKDRNDYWVDISDNDKARRNLLNHINKKGFDAYKDNEESILAKMNNNTFNYPQYHDSVMSAYLNPSNPYNPYEYDNNRKKYNLSQENKEALKEVADTLQEPSNYVVARDATSITPSYSWPSAQDQHTAMPTFEELANAATKPTRQLSNEDRIALDNLSERLTMNPLVQETNSIAVPPVDENRPARLENSEESEGSSWVGKAAIGTSNLLEKGKNYVERQFQKRVNDNDPVSTLKLPEEQNVESNYGIIPQTYTGDTIQVNGRRYILPESIDLNNIKLGVRNRGDNTTLESEGAIITNFNGYKPASSYSGNGTYMGIDKNGNFKVGMLSDFNPEDLVTRTFANKVTSFAVDQKNNQKWKDDAVHGNPGRSVPVVNVLHEDGSTSEGSINILTSKNQKDSNTYGNITGGRVVMEAGNEKRLVSGSIDDIKAQFEDMKKRHNVDYVTFYTLDNGSYNRGLRTKDKKMTAADLKSYDNQNNGGGNFMYILNQDGYPSDTIMTPNIRTENDESYKKGHPLVNEQKGIVLHHTAFMDPDLTSVVNHLRDPKSEASSHVVIGYDGARKVLANPESVTFHAGQSVWNNRDNVNDFMLGIEFQGDTNKKDLTDAQIESAIEYMLPIIRKNNIPLENIVTHQQVRDMYNEFAKKQKQKQAPSKPDINLSNYERIINELKRRLYYSRALGGPLIKAANIYDGETMPIQQMHRPYILTESETTPRAGYTPWGMTVAADTSNLNEGELGITLPDVNVGLDQININEKINQAQETAGKAGIVGAALGLTPAMAGVPGLGTVLNVGSNALNAYSIASNPLDVTNYIPYDRVAKAVAAPFKKYYNSYKYFKSEYPTLREAYKTYTENKKNLDNYKKSVREFYVNDVFPRAEKYGAERFNEEALDKALSKVRFRNPISSALDMFVSGRAVQPVGISQGSDLLRKIQLNPFANNTDKTLVHEVGHYLHDKYKYPGLALERVADDFVPNYKNSGLNFLNWKGGLGKSGAMSDLGAEELEQTMREMRYAARQSFNKKYGRMPSVDEIDDYIKNKNDWDVASAFSRTNGYGEDITQAAFNEMQNSYPLLVSDTDFMLDGTASKLGKAVKNLIVYPSMAGITINSLANNNQQAYGGPLIYLANKYYR